MGDDIHPISYALHRGWYGENRAWLMSACRRNGIRGYSRMTRHEMIEELVRAEAEPAESSFKVEEH